LLSGAELLWFVLLLEKNSHILEDLDGFLTEFNDTFSKTDRVQMATTKLYLLHQGSRPISIYVINFHQLACDFDWDDNAFINAFW
jgi:hypothetical protein